MNYDELLEIGHILQDILEIVPLEKKEYKAIEKAIGVIDEYIEQNRKSL